MLTLKKRINCDVGLGQLTGWIFAFFIGNTSSLTCLGQGYKCARQATQWAALGVSEESTALRRPCHGPVASKPHLHSTSGAK